MQARRERQAAGRWFGCALLGLALYGGAARADDSYRVLINDATVEQTSSNSSPINSGTRRYQVLFDESQFADIPPGSLFKVIQFRLDGPTASAPWPAAEVNASSFQVRLAASGRTPATMSTTFDSNRQDPDVEVYSGPLKILPAAYPAGVTTGPEAWGPALPFQFGYEYNGGPLVIEIAHSGFSVPAPVAAAFLDAAPGSSTLGRGMSATNSGSGTGSTAGAVAVRLAYLPAYVAPGGVTKIYLPEQYVELAAPQTIARPLPATQVTLLDVVRPQAMPRLVPGSLLRGLSFRSKGVDSWPPVNAVYSSYRVDLYRAQTTPATIDTILADNLGLGGPVRTGGLTIPAGALQRPMTGGMPRFTWSLPFNTPYEYPADDLALVIRAQSAQNPAPAAVVLDAAFGDTTTYGTDYATRGADSALATSVDLPLSFPVMRLDVDLGAVVPPAAQVRTGTFQTRSALANDPRTFQFIVSASELIGLPRGSVISGMTFRVDGNGAAFPPSNATFTDYEIYLSTPAVAVGSMSATFANNEGSNRLMVRDGELRIPAGAFPGGSGVNAFGPTIGFNQRGFVYPGGDLCVTIKHSGCGAAVDPDLDADEPSSAGQTAFSVTGGNVATSVLNRLPIVKFIYAPAATTPAALANVSAGVSAAGLTGPKTIQWVIGTADLAQVPIGSWINGIWLRSAAAPGEPVFPGAGTLVTQFDVTIGPAATTPAGMNDTFTLNFGTVNGTGAVLVREGVVTIPPQSLPGLIAPGVPSDFRWFIEFQRPYVYPGGPLTVQIRSSGTAVAPELDAAPSGSTVAARAADAVNATVGTPVNAPVMRLSYTPGFGGVTPSCAGDFNGDRIVDDIDFVIFAQQYNLFDCADPAMPAGCPADLDGTGIVDDIDFVLFARAYDLYLCP